MKLMPLSVRISKQDADYIALLDIAGAKTPSEKVRALISESRQRQSKAVGFDACVDFIQKELTPVNQEILSEERNKQIHSELIARIAEWLPATFACLAAFQLDTDKENGGLFELERELASRVMLLMESVLQMGITTHSPCYDSDLIRSRTESIIELASVIESVKNKVKAKGEGYE